MSRIQRSHSSSRLHLFTVISLPNRQLWHPRLKSPARLNVGVRLKIVRLSPFSHLESLFNAPQHMTLIITTCGGTLAALPVSQLQFKSNVLSLTHNTSLSKVTNVKIFHRTHARCGVYKTQQLGITNEQRRRLVHTTTNVKSVTLAKDGGQSRSETPVAH